MSNQEKAVKTRQTATEAVKEWQMRSHTKEELEFSPNRVHQGFLGGWNAALASMVPGGRFEVGDIAERFEGGQTWISGKVIFLPDHVTLSDQWKYTLRVEPTDKFRPIPQTVGLTVEEKVASLSSKFMGSLPTDERIALLGIAIELANGKTIDELCQDYGVQTTREES